MQQSYTIAGGECEACKNSKMLPNPTIDWAPLRTLNQFSDANGMNFEGSHPIQDFSHIPITARASKPIQAKLRINEPGDKYEQEADRVADQVMRMPEPAIQRQMEPEEDEEEMVQRKTIANQITPLVQRQVSPALAEEAVIQTKATGNQTTPPTSTRESSVAPSSVREALSSPGQPLDPATRLFMEQRFGHDFSQVRVHTDAAAEQSAQDVNARAYTVRTQPGVFFRAVYSCNA